MSKATACLCLSKYYFAVAEKNNYWFRIEAKDLFGMANIIIDNKKRGLMLNDLMASGLISRGKRVDSVSVRANFVNYDSAVMLVVNDFRNLGFRYESIEHNNYIECDMCGLIVKRNGRRQKYCQDCAKKMDRIHAVERYRSSVA